MSRSAPQVAVKSGQHKEAAKSFAVIRDNQIGWRFRDDAQLKTINQLQLLDVLGDVTKCEILR